jgi:superfamily II DNA/RNA helicase
MSESTRKQANELFIVDNSDDDWKVRNYLQEWTEIARSFDIATGYFEIGALLALDGYWQKLEKLRILMGDEVSKRTKQALLDGIQSVKSTLDRSIEKEKESNDFLQGVPAIVDGLKSGKIECRVYSKDKFHAKAYITHAKHAVIGSSALVGSSNFTTPGLERNVELNVQVQREVQILQDWYQRHWDQAEDITPELLKVIERHTREYSPFEIYAKALHEFFRGHEMTVGEWELAGAANGGSNVYPILDQYQKEGYQALMKIASKYSGGFLCDGVGLGKTFIGLMVIERLVAFERKRVMLLVPKAGRIPVWEAALRRYLPNLGGGFTNLRIFNHTDLMRCGEYEVEMKRMAEQADAIVIDEAHHFRNPGSIGKSRYWKLYDIARGKDLFMLTATPINNGLLDLQHMIELFSQRKPDYFAGAPLGIHSIPGHFRKMENALEEYLGGRTEEELPFETNQAEAGKVLFSDSLFRALVVQRSRAYVKASQSQSKGNTAIFPQRADPIVANYSVKKTYGKLLDTIEQAFSKERPLFSLAVYYPLAYPKDPKKKIDRFEENRQKQVVRLIRILFLKRFESSARAFELSCETLLLRLLTWAQKHSQSDGEKRRLQRWKDQNSDILKYVQGHRVELYGGEPEEDADEDIVSDEMLNDIEEISRNEFKIDEILSETFLDLDQIAEFLGELKKFKPSHDDKLKALIQLLKSDPVLKKHKVLIFTEYMATARYLKKELENTGLKNVDEVDSASGRDRGDIIRQFAPYYNESSSADLATQGLDETRILISTDVLSEGLNLQDATRLINYDLHWNPVRLMQRIGRVDRRMNPEIEKRLLTDHPDEKDIRGTAAYWNFLPPDEVDELLKLYKKVSHKTLRISKTFGIEGKKLLKPEDDYEALKDFAHDYEGATSDYEEMHLEYQRLIQADPELPSKLTALPGKVFSGKEHSQAGTQALFFCYVLPAPSAAAEEHGAKDALLWKEETGQSKWYLFDLATEKIVEEPTEILGFIKSLPETPRHCALEKKKLSDIRAQVEKYIKNSYLRRVQAPIGVKPILKAWMEIS